MTGQNWVAENALLSFSWGILFSASLEDLNVEIGFTLQEDNFFSGNEILTGWITAGPLEEKFQILQVEEYLEYTNTNAYFHFPYIMYSK
jgi:hypothetical protein